MPFPALNLTAALLAASAYANSILPSENLVLRSHDVLHKPYAALLARVASESPPIDYFEDGIPMLQTRQNNNGGSTNNEDAASNSPSGLNATEPGIVLNPDRSLNFTAWSESVNPACAQALSTLRQATNPSGACVCYNIISLDMDNWRFEADLRLFEVSDARGDFTGIPVETIRVLVNYNGAEANGTNITDTGSSRAGAPNDDTRPRLNQVYRIKGQIDTSRVDSNMTVSALEIILVPSITLRGLNRSTAAEVRTPVSLNEAAFLAGVFSSQSVMSDFSAAQLAVSTAMEQLRNGTTAFILPGTQIMVVPIGLVITGTWLLIGLTIYGFGTFERMRYADMYKSRTARIGKASNTI
ncbi:hypothetical protein LIA77_11886 [Sarocladium implicatum]|nr:hypothetical protein LIA77_11886 [Sarocladium implicatum]